MIAPKQTATQLRRNLMLAKGSQHMHMDPAQLCLIQRRVQSAHLDLIKQKLDTSTVLESLSELIQVGWCAAQEFYAAFGKHNDD